MTKYCTYITYNYKPNGTSFKNTANPTRKLLLSAFLTSGLAALYVPKQKHLAHGFWPHISLFSQQAAQPVLKEDETEKEVAPKFPLKDVWKDSKITLYQYQNCPFCSKVRAFLRAYDIPFEMIEVHPFTKKEISFSKYKKLPLVTIQQGDQEHQINDSSVIMSVMASYMIDNTNPIAETIANFPTTTEVNSKGKEVKVIRNKNYLFIDEHLLTPEKEKALLKESKWRNWCDDYFIHLISPNLYRTLGESYSAFEYHISLGPYYGTWEGFAAKYFGSAGMWLIGKLVKRKYGVSEDVRVDLYAACNKIVVSGLRNNKFLGGDEPNLADISLFGMLSVMEHQVVMADLSKNTKIMKWYNRTKRYINKNRIQDLRHDLKYEKAIENKTASTQ